MAHMEALCRVDSVKVVYLFAPESYKSVPKLRYTAHSPRISAWFGDGIARIIGAWRLAKTIQPDLVVGYHLPWNGLMALLIARRFAAEVAYFSVGGPPEIIGGGIYSEHALFSRLSRESPYIESLFVRFLREFDAILTMGTRSRDFFESIEAGPPAIPIAVGINDARFSARQSEHLADLEFDLVSVGRLSAIKQTDKFVGIVAELEKKGRNIRAAVVGDGDQLENLQSLARELGVLESIQFFGWIDNVEEVLQQSRLFVMTSASEGLPHSLIEAMLTEMPAIVPDVGEIGDLVVNGSNGYLVSDNSALSFADRAAELLDSPETTIRFGKAARRTALQYTVDQRVAVWSNALDHVMQNPADGQSE